MSVMQISVLSEFICKSSDPIGLLVICGCKPCAKACWDKDLNHILALVFIVVLGNVGIWACANWPTLISQLPSSGLLSTTRGKVAVGTFQMGNYIQLTWHLLILYLPNHNIQCLTPAKLSPAPRPSATTPSPHGRCLQAGAWSRCP